MSEPFGSVNFSAAMLAVNGPAAIGQALVYDSDAGTWLIATSANRTALGKRAEAIAITPYGGSVIGKVAYRSSGLLPNEFSLLDDGLTSWVRVKSDGYLERCTPGVGDDLVGKCSVDGRLQLQMNTWDSTNISGGSGATPGGSTGDLQTNGGAGTFGAVASGNNGDTVLKVAGVWTPQPAITSPTGTGVWGITGGVPDAAASLGTANQILSTNGTATGLTWITASSGFTAGGDLSGSSSSQQVEAATGATSLFTLRATAPTMQWVVATTTPRLNQADVTTNSATGQSLTVQAQNATGTTATGGALNLTSGTGTSAAGSVAIQTGGTARLTVAPTSGTLNFVTLQFASNVVSPVIRQADDTTNGVTGDTMQINAQNCTGTTTTGGTLDIRSGTGTTIDGNVAIRCGSSTRLLLAPAIAQGDILRSSSATGPFERFARGTALQYLRVNSGGTDIEWATLALTIANIGATNGQVPYGAGGTLAQEADFTYDSTTNQVTTTGGYRVGSSTWAADGWFRGPYTSSATTVLAIRNVINSGDYVLIESQANAASLWGVDGGVTTLRGATAIVSASSAGSLRFNATEKLGWDTSHIYYSVPRHGNSTPYASDGLVIITGNAGGGTLLSAAQYSRQLQNYDGNAEGTWEYPNPANADAYYEKTIAVDTYSGGGGGTLTIKCGSATLSLSGLRDGIARKYGFANNAVFRIQ